MKNLKRYFTLLVLLSALFACKDEIVESTPAINDNDDSNANAVLAKFSDIQSKVFNTTCATSGCHVSGVQPPELSGDSYDRIVNKPSFSAMDYIEPGDPDNSYLYQKIIGGNISGSRMPIGGSPLSQEITDSIRVWIENGALRN